MIESPKGEQERVADATQTKHGADSTSVDDPGVTVDHEEQAQGGYPVSPTTHASWTNTLRPAFPRPVGCSLLGNPYFAFDSSVILPTISLQLANLRPLVKEGRRIALFGHADPVGDVEYNKVLSGRRARAVYGLLTRNVDIWMQLNQPVDGDTWGLASSQMMLGTLTNANSKPYYSGVWNGRFTQVLGDGIRAFQKDQGLRPDGVLYDPTRRALYRRYMDAICLSASDPWTVSPEQFLGNPKDANGRCAYQGCSEHNPVLLFSKEQKQVFDRASDKTQRNVANAPNRRVMAFVFREIDFGPLDPTNLGSAWPCPSWNETTSKCKAQFWEDWKERLANGDKPRRYAKRERTMACAFYDQFARVSPCEGPRSVNRLTIWILDRMRRPMPTGTPYRVAVDGQIREGVLRCPGLIVENGLRLDDSEYADVEWGDYQPIQFSDSPRGEGRDSATIRQSRTTSSGAASRSQFAAEGDKVGEPAPSATPTRRTITREELHVPVSVAEMRTEANQSIDPDTVDWIEPNRPGHVAPTDDGYFLGKKLVAWNRALPADEQWREFDNRLFHTYPLFPRWWRFPASVIEDAERRKYANARRLHLIDVDAAGADPTALAGLQLENLGYGRDGLEQFRCDQRLSGDDQQAKQALQDFHQDPASFDKGKA